MQNTVQSYNKHAQNYERRWAAYLEHTHDVFLRQLDISETDEILDLSGGTGLLAYKILEKDLPFKRLVLNDPADEMLSVAKDRLPKNLPIHYSNAQAHNLPFEDNRFTKIFSLNAFHNYNHQETVISEIRRVLKPGGRFYLQDWNRSGFFRPVNTLIRWWVPEHIDTRSAGECRQMLKTEGFHIELETVWNYRYWKFYHIQARTNRDFRG